MQPGHCLPHDHEVPALHDLCHGVTCSLSCAMGSRAVCPVHYSAFPSHTPILSCAPTTPTTTLLATPSDDRTWTTTPTTTRNCSLAQLSPIPPKRCYPSPNPTHLTLPKRSLELAFQRCCERARAPTIHLTIHLNPNPNPKHSPYSGYEIRLVPYHTWTLSLSSTLAQNQLCSKRCLPARVCSFASKR